MIALVRDLLTKTFVGNLLVTAFAIPMGLGVLSVNFGEDSLGDVVGPLIAHYDNTSAGIWVAALGDGIAKGPWEHLLRTFTVFLFLPSLFYTVYKLVRHRNGHVWTALRNKNGIFWLMTNFIAIFVLTYSLVPKFSQAFNLLAIFAMTVFIVRYALFPGGDKALVAKFTPPGRQGQTDLLTRATPFIFFSMIVITLLQEITEFPSIAEGRWVYVVLVAVELLVISCSAFLGNRLPAVVFLVASGVALCGWVDREVLEGVRQFSAQWNIVPRGSQ